MDFVHSICAIFTAPWPGGGECTQRAEEMGVKTSGWGDIKSLLV